MRGFFRNIFFEIRASLIPALLFFVAIMIFFIKENILPSSQITLHYSFYALALICILFLLFFNQRRPIFFILILVATYIILNLSKKLYDADFVTSSAYQNLALLVPINLFALFFLPQAKFVSKTNVFLLLGFFAEFAILEHLAQNKVVLINFEFAPLLYYFLGLLLFVWVNISSSYLNYALFFSTISVMLGIFYAASSTALSIFFALAMALILLAVLIDLYFQIYTHSISGLKSRNTFLMEIKDLPLKYSLGVMCIDDYSNLCLKFGKTASNRLVKMVASIIDEAHIKVFHYNMDEFILLYHGLDKNESFEEIEKIRREVATTQFVLPDYKTPLNLTVSAVVAEKKRSDFSCMEVLGRANKIFAKTKNFNHNLTTKA